MRYRVLLGAIALVLAVAPARGQDAEGRRVSFGVSAGLTVPVFGTGGAVAAGWDVGANATVEAWRGFGVRADYLYHLFGVTEDHLTVGTLGAPSAIQKPVVEGRPQMHVLGVDLVYTRPLSARRASLSVFAGPALFHQRAKITLPGGDQLFAPLAEEFCRPRWLSCDPAGADWDPIIGIHKSNDIGFSVGGGLRFDAGLTAQVTIEARYLRVAGPSFALAGRTVRKTGHFVPITVGLRF